MLMKLKSFKNFEMGEKSPPPFPFPIISSPFDDFFNSGVARAFTGYFAFGDVVAFIAYKCAI